MRTWSHSLTRADWLTLVAGAVLVCLLYLASLQSYLLLHTLSEVLFIVVCLSVVVMAWSLGNFLDDDFAVFLGAALVAVAALHMAHLLDYPGLGLLSGSLDPPTQIWLAARFLLACSLIAAAFVVGRRISLPIAGALLAGYWFVIMASVYWWHVFPSTLGHSGLTPFKVAAEYVICGLFAVAGVLLYRRRQELPPGCWRLLRLAIAASVVAELWFTMYQRATAWPNMLGHLFLVLSALLLFRALVDDGLARPHALAVRNLREAESMHHRLEQGLMPSIRVESERLRVLTQYHSGERHLTLSGDFIDVLDRGGDGVAVICGDVSGHGANAAALGAMLRSSWQALMATGADALGVVDGLRAVLERERKDSMTYATLVLAWLEADGGSLRMLNLGHPVPLLVAGGEVVPLPVAPIPPLGTVDWPVVEPAVMALPEGWQLLFYTDGLIEPRLDPGSSERYGEERLIEAVRTRVSGGNDPECLEKLLEDVEAVAEPFSDDVAVILISEAAAPERGCGPRRAGGVGRRAIEDSLGTGSARGRVA